MNKILSLVIAVIIFSCGTSESYVRIKHMYHDIDSIRTDYLILFPADSDSSIGQPCGYKNVSGEIIIPKGKYSHCFTDTFRNFAIVWDEKNTNSETVAIDRNERILFDVFYFDNYPDEFSDGLFRVIRNEKIGYANEYGRIVIPCQFQCAYRFENGRAKVALHCKEFLGDCEHKAPESDEWFYIDKKGNRVE